MKGKNEWLAAMERISLPYSYINDAALRKLKNGS